MKDYAQAANPRGTQLGPRLVKPSSPVSVNVNCGGSTGEDSTLPSFHAEADQYLATEAKPLFLVPLWVWLGVAALGAGWYFWGRKHFKISAL